MNTVCPGLTWTEMSTGNATPEELRVLEQSVPMRRGAAPEEISYGVLYLASDEARYVTGIKLVIDGGMTTHTHRIGEKH